MLQLISVSESFSLSLEPSASLTLHFIRLHYITLPFIRLDYITLNYIKLHNITLHFISLDYITLHQITLHYISLDFISFHQISFHQIRLNCITFHCNKTLQHCHGTVGFTLHQMEQLAFFLYFYATSIYKFYSCQNHVSLLLTAHKIKLLLRSNAYLFNVVHRFLIEGNSKKLFYLWKSRKNYIFEALVFVFD